MALNEHDALPLYKQLVEALRNDIHSGKYPEGSKLPSEAELSIIYQVSRITVRAALKELESDELITRQQGKGTFIGKRKFKRNLSMATSFSQACREMGKKPGAKTLFAGFEYATENDRKALHLPEGSQVVCFRRLRYADNIPISLEEDRFPVRYSFLLDEDLTDKSLLQLLAEKYGIRFYDVHRTVELVLASHNIARSLNCPLHTPMLYIVSEGLDTVSHQPGQRSLQYIIGENFTLYI